MGPILAAVVVETLEMAGMVGKLLVGHQTAVDPAAAAHPVDSGMAVDRQDCDRGDRCRRSWPFSWVVYQSQEC